MRTTILFTMIAAVIAAGFLVLATTTSNAAFAQTGPSTSATSSISQSNTQTATSTDGTFNSFSCNQLAANINFDNAVSTAIASAFGSLFLLRLLVIVEKSTESTSTD